jgi:DNA repair protein RecO (recombination protein O)
MNYLKDTGYVVKRVNYSEADKYITILTQSNGKIEVLAKGVRKLTSRRSPQLELLNKISFQAVSRGQNSRYVLADTRLLTTHATLKEDLDCVKTLFTMCELVSTLCPSYQKQDEAFFLLDKTLSCMKANTHAFDLQGFQVKLLSILGFWDARHPFVDASDITQFTERIMERKIKTTEYFKS